MHNNLPKFFIFLDHYSDHIFNNNNTNMGVIYRNSKGKNKQKELIKIANMCKRKKMQLFVSNDIKLTLKVKANGLYIPAFSKKKFHNLENKRLKILGSAHNTKQIYEKISQKCNAIFLSPVFYMRKYKKFLNIYKFNLLSNINKIDFMALGGINDNNIRRLKLLNISGFGGIRMFKKKPAYKRPVFLKNKFSFYI